VQEGGFAFEDNGQQIMYRLAVGHRHGAQPGHSRRHRQRSATADQWRGHSRDYTLVRPPANLPGGDRAAIKVRIRVPNWTCRPTPRPTASQNQGTPQGRQARQLAAGAGARCAACPRLWGVPGLKSTFLHRTPGI
jgi:hypothetical protein